MSDLRPAIFAVNSVLIVLSFAAISCRLGTRLFLVKLFGWHDALIALAALCATVFSILQMASARLGFGLPIDNVLASTPNANLNPILELIMVSNIFYFLCNWMVKHSLLLFYAELTIDLWPRRSIYFMHAIAFGFGCGCVSATIFQCVPLPNINPSFQCISMDTFNYFNSCIMLATDVVLYAMPLVFTWKLHLPRPQRMGVQALFALGALVLAASGARVYYVKAQVMTPDFTYMYAATMICAVIENHLAIIVACAPSIKVILFKIFRNLASRFKNSVSKESLEHEKFKSSGVTKEVMRPLPPRALTDESQRSREIRTGKWWKAPSSWDVNAAGRIPDI